MTNTDYPFVLLLFAVIAYSCWLTRNVKKVEKKLNSPAPPKFCKDCLHYSNSSFESQYPTRHTVFIHTCLAPKPPKFDLITGEEFAESFPNCSNMRDPSALCGPEAKLFHPKPPICGNLPNP